MSLALRGRVQDALTVSAGRSDEPTGPGWMRMDELRRAVHAATRCYGGDVRAARTTLEDLVAAGAAGGPEPATTLLLRLRRLVDGAQGLHDTASLRAALDALRERAQLLYLSLVVLETVDLADDAAAHEAVAAALPPDGGGLVSLAASVSAARVRGDAGTVLAEGLRLEAGGLVTLGLRVLSDAVRLADDEPVLRGRARAGVLRLLREWDGAEPWWLGGDVPTPRQREVAFRVATGATPAEVAGTLVLSRRTVENHLQAVYTHLGTHRRHDLVTALRAPGPP